MPRLTMKSNWNHKLDCDFFTTIRLDAPVYEVGQKWEIWHDNKVYKTVEIVDIKRFTIDKLNPWMAALDTGYSVEECKNLLHTFWGKEVKDWNTQLFAYLLLKTIKTGKK